MADAAPQLDATTRAAIAKLADIAVPPPVSWAPQTWGWAVVAALLLVFAGWLAARGVRRYVANRYRREALRELAGIETQPADGVALAAIAELLKRVALAAWPRMRVASLSGPAWVAFLRDHAGGAGFADDAARLLDDLEYRGSPPDADAVRQAAHAVRRWIEAHDVSA